MRIEKATKNHIPFIQQIAQITWYKTYTFLPEGQIEYMLNLMYSNEALQLQMQQGHQFFIAIENAEIIGFASTSAIENNVFKLHKLYVLPTHQKLGAGKDLLQAVINFAKQNNATYLQLQVNRNNAAKNFYAKKGFAIIEEKDFDIGNNFFMKDYIMQLTLTNK